ncbi:hypothetical protein [Phyllobacterium sp. UNC302MFCol5.2]|uniref:hypothetical protein n=1 Tax=Phyllobacterium sp. UNC302MFCol5.2 TaxID=1449065 RepID=UPI0012DCE374|nr:hypothetical protein [Phyllobacterium sp. UNC302MFCol5.2]
MFEIFRAVKMTLTGTVLRQIDIQILEGRCLLSLRLKREKPGSHYVVLAGLASGNYQYYPMKRDEFIEFATNVAQMKAALQQEEAHEPLRL